MRHLSLAVLALCGILSARDIAVPAAEPARSATAPPQPPYFGQAVPGTTPQPFAPGVVNTPAIELNGVFTPDGREFFFTRLLDGIDTMFHVVSSSRPGGHGQSDLYVAHKQENGRWGELVNLGPTINSDQTDFCPMVTPDGKYLFFSRRWGATWEETTPGMCSGWTRGCSGAEGRSGFGVTCPVVW